jgi:hypothetical protein
MFYIFLAAFVVAIAIFATILIRSVQTNTLLPSNGIWLDSSQPNVTTLTIALSSSDRRVRSGTFQLLISDDALQVSLDRKNQWMRFLYPQWFVTRESLVKLSLVSHQQFAGGSKRDGLRIGFNRQGQDDALVVMPTESPMESVVDLLSRKGWTISP